MKRLLLSAFFFATLWASAQIPTTDSLRKEVNKWVGNSPVTAFQQLRMNRILYSAANLIDSARLGTLGSVGVDTMYSLNDSTIRYKKNAVWYQFVHRGIGGGGGGGSTPPGGSDTYIQFNNAGAFGGDAGLTYNLTLNRLSTDTIAAINGRLRLLEFPNLDTRTIRWHNINADTSVIGTRPYGEFNITQSEAFVNEDGQRDVVQMIGYNNDGVGGVRNTNEAGLWLSLESHYIPFPGGQPQFEWFLQSKAKNGNVNRHIALDINKNTGISSGYFRSAGWTFFGDNTNDYYGSIGNGGLDVNNFTPGGNSVLRLYNDNGVGLFFINSTPGQTIISNSGASMLDLTLTTPRYLTFSNQITFNSAADLYTGGNVTFDLPTQNLNKSFAFRDFGQDAILTLRDSIGTTQHIVEVNGRMRIAGLGNGTGDQDVIVDAYGNFKTGVLSGGSSGGSSGGYSLTNPIVEDTLLRVVDDSTLLIKAPVDGPGYTVTSTDTTFQILLSGNYVTPYDYGAVLDSTVDNSAAFLALWANVGYKPIYIPPGVWYIPNTKLTLPRKGGHIFGAGMGVTVLKMNYINTTGGAGVLNNIDALIYGDTSMTNTTIHDFTIRHSGSSAVKHINQAMITGYMGTLDFNFPGQDFKIENVNIYNMEFTAPDVSFAAIKFYSKRSGYGGTINRFVARNLKIDRMGGIGIDLAGGYHSSSFNDTRWLQDITLENITANDLGRISDYGFALTLEPSERSYVNNWKITGAKNIGIEVVNAKQATVSNIWIKGSKASTLAIAMNGHATHNGEDNRMFNVLVSDTNSLGIQIQRQVNFKSWGNSFTSNGLIQILGVTNSSFTGELYDYRGTSSTTVLSIEGGSQNNTFTDITVRGDSATSGTFSSAIVFNGATTTGNLVNGANIRSGSGGGTPVTETASATGNLVTNYSVNGTRFNHSGTWSQTSQLQKIGSYYIWFDGSGRLRHKSSIPTADTDGTVLVPIPAGGSAGQVLEKSSGTDYALTWGTDDGGGGSGTVTNFIFTDGNGLDGTVTLSTTTPTLSIAPSFTGMVKSNGTAFLAAVAQTDYTLLSGLTSTYIPRASSANAIVNGSFRDNGTEIGLGQAPVASTIFGVTGSSNFTGAVKTSGAASGFEISQRGAAANAWVLYSSGTTGDLEFYDYEGTGGNRMVLTGTTGALNLLGTAYINSGGVEMLTINRTTGLVGTQVISGGGEASTASNGLTLSGVDIKLGGTLTGATAIDGAQTFSMGATTPLSSFYVKTGGINTIESNSSYTFINSGLMLGNGTATDANTTIQAYEAVKYLITITANRTLTLPANGAGKTLWIHNNNTSAFTWTFSGTAVHDEHGNALLTVPRGAMQLQYNGAGHWKIVSLVAGSNSVEYISSIQADYTLTAGTAAQSAFPSAQDAILLDATTTYEMEGLYIMNTGTITHNTGLSFALAGGATITNIQYVSDVHVGTVNAIVPTNTAAAWITHVSAATNNVVTNSNTAAWTIIRFKGLLRMNAGGTVTPQITFSANPTGTNLMKVGSYIKFTKKGSNTMAAFGPWN